MSEEHAITEVEQEETDYDWFGVDERGCVGHFTTAGFKLLPKSVSVSAEELEKVTNYFRHLPPTDSTFQVSGDLEKETGPFESEEKRDQYLASFSDMARKGLYSFDIDTYVSPGLAYFQVTSPFHPLQLESLPPEIRTIVGRTRLKGVHLGETTRIDYETTLGF